MLLSVIFFLTIYSMQLPSCGETKWADVYWQALLSVYREETMI